MIPSQIRGLPRRSSSVYSYVFWFFALFVIYISWGVTNHIDVEVTVPVATKFTVRGDTRACTIHTCLDLRQCVYYPTRLTVYVQPLLNVVDEDGNRVNPDPSHQFLTLRRVILNSDFVVHSEEDACLVLPGIDTLSTLRFASPLHLSRSLDAAASLFEHKPNLVVFSQFGSKSEFGDCIVISASHLETSFRRGFDVAIGPLIRVAPQSRTQRFGKHRVVLPLPFGIQPKSTITEEVLQASSEVKVISKCEHDFVCIGGKEVHFENTLKSSDFAIISENAIGFDQILSSVLHANVTPVFVSDAIVKPFSEFIDWSEHSFTIPLANLRDFLKDKAVRLPGAFDSPRFDAMLTLSHNVISALTVLEERIVPASIVSEDTANADAFVPVCDHHLTIILHERSTSERKLRWAVRRFYYGKSNSSEVIIASETEIDGLFEDFVIPTETVPFNVVRVPSISAFPSVVELDSVCPVLLVNSRFPVTLLDDAALMLGFSAVSDSPNRIAVFPHADVSDSPTYFCRSRFLAKAAVAGGWLSVPEQCVPIGSDAHWISCPSSLLS